MIKTLAILLLKLLLGYLGSDLDEQARQQSEDYNRQKAAAEEEQEKSAAEILELENGNKQLDEERREKASKRIVLNGEIEQINNELEKLSHEKADKLRRIDDLSDSDVLRAEF
jgi:septal ring factor EnvC (AmiA/AmiB activator)